jgi:DUF4097 and DUF4098 domain-containing protein YvlB
MTKSCGIRVAALVTLLGLCACVGSMGDRVHESFNQTMPATGISSVHVDNAVGQVRISGWSKPTIGVEAVKYASDLDQVHAMTIDVHADGSTGLIATKYSGAMHDGGVRYHIWVPNNLSLVVDNGTGTVDVAGVTGSVTVRTDTGTVVADLGKVDDGRSIDLTAATGAIRLLIAKDSSANVDARSSIGDFSSDFPNITVTRENLVGVSATGRLGAGSATIHLTTRTGSIALRAGS